MQYNDAYNEQVFSFVNNINTIEGGTHLSGFRSAPTSVVNDYIKKNEVSKIKDLTLSGDDAREGLTAVISVKVPNPQFEGQTKTKLGNSEVEGITKLVVNDYLSAFLEENPAIANKIIEKAVLAAKPEKPQEKRASSPDEKGRWIPRSSRQARRLFGKRPRKERDIHSRRRLGRRFGEAGQGPPVPGDTAAKRQDP